jgi:hypothetical protein
MHIRIYMHTGKPAAVQEEPPFACESSDSVPNLPATGAGSWLVLDQSSDEGDKTSPQNSPSAVIEQQSSSEVINSVDAQSSIDGMETFQSESQSSSEEGDKLSSLQSSTNAVVVSEEDLQGDASSSSNTEMRDLSLTVSKQRETIRDKDAELAYLKETVLQMESDLATLREQSQRLSDEGTQGEGRTVAECDEEIKKLRMELETARAEIKVCVCMCV